MAMFFKWLSFPFILFSEKVNASLSDLSKTQPASVDRKGREKTGAGKVGEFLFGH